MEAILKKELQEEIKKIKLPTYEEIPDVGLYLDQVTTYINEYTQNILDTPITNSMVSNYVKKKIIANPVKKLYSREQIAFLIYIQLAKNVIPLEELLLMQQLHENFNMKTSYNYFAEQLLQAIYYVSDMHDAIDEIKETSYIRKSMLKSSIMAIANKVYFSKCCKIVRNHPEIL